MTVRLTESRLRQIIREELASLSTRPIREAALSAEDLAAGDEGMARSGLNRHFDIESIDAADFPQGETIYTTDDVSHLVDQFSDERVLALLPVVTNYDEESYRLIVIEAPIADARTGTVRFYGNRLTFRPALAAVEAADQAQRPSEGFEDAPMTSPRRGF